MKNPRYLAMTRVRTMLILLPFVISQTLGSDNIHSHCKDKSLSYLDVAADMISKAKLYFPEVPTTFEEKTYRPIDCEEVLHSGHNKSGVYTIWPRSRMTDGRSLEVYCDMDTDGGGWTVIQRRGNFHRSSDYFFRNWASYKNGFGEIEKDFWLGNDNIFALTNQRIYSIRFDLKDIDGEKRYALYDIFWIDGEKHKYTLFIQDYSGDAGSSKYQPTTRRSVWTRTAQPTMTGVPSKYRGAW
ncbi:Techylectin-5A [Araneus ventricosus]|uniref:Techylectin-5A n=1 Tax=Araneus ventricosus TaxID=182803 RepID=A0A4Y2N0R4_ARAVE|nr:Techylectin-5A [Araneus ventricosus]